MAEIQGEMVNEQIIEKVKKFMHDTCGCALGVKSGLCSGQFFEFNFNNCLELSNDELDLVILASIQAFTHLESVELNKRGILDAASTISQYPFARLTLLRTEYPRFWRLKEHYQNHGVSLRTHGNKKRLPHNTLSQAIVKGVKAFLSNYGEENLIRLPRRIPGFKSDEIKILSSSQNSSTGIHALVLRTLWKQLELKNI